VYVNGQADQKDKVKATVVLDASIALALGLLSITFWQHKSSGGWAIAVLWAAACLVIGAIIGFLFGIPRPANRSSTKDESPIEQIADWLTKIIVGLSLTKLGKIPGYLDSLASYVMDGIGKETASHSAALAMILYFSALGFIGGCVLTNIFLEDIITLIKKS
jgi:ABC-type amino acid transport system permease subunit